MRRRKRCDGAPALQPARADPGLLQPYVDQAAADKIRAEKEKEAFSVSGLNTQLPSDREPDLDPSVQNKKEKKEESVGSGDEEEE